VSVALAVFESTKPDGVIQGLVGGSSGGSIPLAQLESSVEELVREFVTSPDEPIKDTSLAYRQVRNYHKLEWYRIFSFHERTL